MRLFLSFTHSNRVRLYSIKTFKSLGALEYHKNGVQAVAFARSAPPLQNQGREGGGGSRSGTTLAPVEDDDSVGSDGEDEEFSNSEIEARNRWLVVGGKDGRISIWKLMDFTKPKPRTEPDPSGI